MVNASKGPSASVYADANESTNYSRETVIDSTECLAKGTRVFNDSMDSIRPRHTRLKRLINFFSRKSPRSMPLRRENESPASQSERLRRSASIGAPKAQRK